MLHVDSNSVIRDVQESFQDHFPDFKLEFIFGTGEKLNAGKSLRHSFPSVRIGELCDCMDAPALDIVDTMTVDEVEKEFRHHFGLPAVIYSRDGNYWLKNSTLSQCTLKHLNNSL